MAPEMIFAADSTAFLTKGDVYSYAILLWALFARAYPYRDTRSSMFSLLKSIAEEGLRPSLEGFPAPLATLIETCWRNDPAERPSFASILEVFKGDGLLESLQDLVVQSQTPRASFELMR